MRLYTKKDDVGVRIMCAGKGWCPAHWSAISSNEDDKNIDKINRIMLNKCIKAKDSEQVYISYIHHISILKNKAFVWFAKK